MNTYFKFQSILFDKFLEKKINNLIGNLSFFYLISWFFMPYKPEGFIDFHNIILVFGFSLVLWRELRKISLRGIVFDRDIVVLIGVVFLFVFSSAVIHIKEFSRAGFQPYILAFATFLFFRFSVKDLNLKRFYNFAGIYLLLSGIIILFQVNFGKPFYVASFFTKEVFGLGYQGLGFADNPTLTGGIMLWFLTVLVAYYSVSAKCGGILCKIFILGSIGLGASGIFYTTNRASWIALFLIILLIGVFVFKFSLNKKFFCLSVFSILIFISVFGFLFRSNVYKLNDKISFLERIVFLPMETIKYDASVNTRLRMWGLCLDLIKEYPIWGIGPLQYSKYNKSKFPKKLIFLADEYIDSKYGYLDPRSSMTPHNSYLHYMTEVGILPAIPLFGLILLILIKGFYLGPKLKSFPFLMGLVGICLWIGTCDYITDRIFWIVLGTVAGFVFNNGIELNKKEKQF